MCLRCKTYVTSVSRASPPRRRRRTFRRGSSEMKKKKEKERETRKTKLRMIGGGAFAFARLKTFEDSQVRIRIHTRDVNIGSSNVTYGARNDRR